MHQNPALKSPLALIKEQEAPIFLPGASSAGIIDVLFVLGVWELRNTSPQKISAVLFALSMIFCLLSSIVLLVSLLEQLNPKMSKQGDVGRKLHMAPLDPALPLENPLVWDHQALFGMNY